MKKGEIIKQIKNVVEGNSTVEWIGIVKRGENWKIVGAGLIPSGTYPREDHFENDVMFFEHDRNECTFAEAKELLEAKIGEK